MSTALGAGMGALILVMAILVGIYWGRAYRSKWAVMDFEKEIQRMIEGGEIDSALVGPSAKTPRELKRSNLILVKKIGSGAFGEVHKGTLDESRDGGVPEYDVAVKTALEAGEGTQEFVREAAIMAQVETHPNLVSLIGVVSSGLPMLLVLSLCEHGSLLSVVQKRADQKGPVRRRSLEWHRSQ